MQPDTHWIHWFELFKVYPGKQDKHYELFLSPYTKQSGFDDIAHELFPSRS
jgi:hypothetical protein